MSNHEPIGPVDATVVPRYAGLATFARLPRLDEVGHADVAVLGVPFDSGVSYRPGRAVRAGAHPAALAAAAAVQPGAGRRAVRARSRWSTPATSRPTRSTSSEAITPDRAGRRRSSLGTRTRLLTLGGDHTIALPLLRAMHARHGPVAVLHFDAHLDTWDTYFGEPYTHGTPFRRAAEEGLIDPDALACTSASAARCTPHRPAESTELGFATVHCTDWSRLGRRRRRRADAASGSATRPVYVSVDIDVLDPAHAPGTGTPEAGGLTSRELLAIAARARRARTWSSADIVEVAPAYDHAELTGIAAAHVGYELLSVMAVTPERHGSIGMTREPSRGVNGTVTMTSTDIAADQRCRGPLDRLRPAERAARQALAPRPAVVHVATPRSPRSRSA